MCDDLVTFVIFYHASQLRTMSVISRFVKIPPKSPPWVGNRNICDRVVAIR